MRAKRRRLRWLLAGLVLVAAPLEQLAFPPEAQAVVGRPLTPVSYAGAARRTTRRTVAATAATHPHPYPYW